MTETRTKSIGEALRLPGGMPARLRLAAVNGEITPEMCEHADRLIEQADAEEVEIRRRSQEAFRDRMWREACGDRYAGARLATLAPQQDPGGAVSGWLASGKRTLILHGSQPRRGKTHAAYAIGWELRGRGEWVCAWHAIGLNDALRPSATDPDRPERVLQWAQECPLVILDDLGTEQIRGWTVERLRLIAEERGKVRGRRTIITTNLGYTELERRYGQSLMDRFIEGAALVKIEGKPLSGYAPF